MHFSHISVARAVCITTYCQFALILAGCNSEGPVPVTGTITFEGKPVADASITFTPATRSEGKVAVGATDESGRFSLSLLTGEDKEGAMPGDYKVSISKVEMEGGTAANNKVSESLGSFAMESAAPKRTKNLLPPKYSSASTSGLSFEVKRGEDNTADFELTE